MQKFSWASRRCDVTRLKVGKCLALRASCMVLLPLIIGVTFCTAAEPAGKGAVKSRITAAASGPQRYTSRSVALTTDMPADEAKELLQRLETILVQVGRYWGKPNSQVIEMYVVKDLSKWPDNSFPPEALHSISTGGGLTMSRTASAVDRATGRKTAHLGTKSIVYAVADRGTPQHEAVHAYCAQTFGTTGPTWFSEGIAELGQYWRDKEISVGIHPEVLRYLQANNPKPLEEIVDLSQVTGDNWQNYAWRWALCHLLAFNPNYSARFRPLGLDLLREGNQTFESVYGSMAREIAFEYEQFIANIENGYRVDLCAWDWKAKAIVPRGKAFVSSKIDSDRGWQSARIQVQSGKSYEFTAEGEWQTAKDGEKTSADGDSSGNGRLIGTLFNDYALSQPIEFGSSGRFTATQDGVLFLRCREDWHSIADNSGTLSVRFRVAD